ncbi:protein of unknown function (plasmid) [Azospirillum baldaniorum]|uniref:Uncharacterized protein n=1 Tax=Azospirillum baldaniorum TaxID=1064539 RepID=A0A9P1NPC1_9PROT|nr:protein of unknown function [Azospirillum baldaniorum]
MRALSAFCPERPCPKQSSPPPPHF